MVKWEHAKKLHEMTDLEILAATKPSPTVNVLLELDERLKKLEKKK